MRKRSLSHSEKEHGRTFLSRHIREITYGGLDGIITTFAVVCGYLGAKQGIEVSAIPISALLIFGLANLFADGFSMALGNLLSTKSDIDSYKREKALELKEFVRNPKNEVLESAEYLQKEGFNANDALSIAELFSHNSQFWSKYTLESELGLSQKELEKPFLNSISTFLSFVFFGFIPLIPFTNNDLFSNSITTSIVLTAVAIVSLGLIRAIITKTKLIKVMAETVLIGASASMIAYLVGILVSK